MCKSSGCISERCPQLCRYHAAWQSQLTITLRRVTSFTLIDSSHKLRHAIFNYLLVLILTHISEKFLDVCSVTDSKIKLIIFSIQQDINLHNLWLWKLTYIYLWNFIHLVLETNYWEIINVEKYRKILLKNIYQKNKKLIKKECKLILYSFKESNFLRSCQNFALAESLRAERHDTRLAYEGCLPVPLLRILSFLIIGSTLLSRASRMERALKRRQFPFLYNTVHK